MNRYETLTNILKKYNNILIMTHKDPDLDGFSSSLVFNKILNFLGINNKVYINDNELDSSIKKSLIKLEEKDFFITKEEIKNENFDLLIVLDTNKPEILEDTEMLDKIKDVIIIDHHIKGNSIIKSIFEIIDESFSSTAEIVIEYIKDLNLNLNENLYTMLLAGIEIDTNEFSVKVTPKTFYLAAYLLEKGANLILKQELLKENKIEHIKKQYFVRKSFIYNDNLLISILDENIYDKKYLATISEELLQFEGIEASFTIGHISENEIGISARSLGNIDVEDILSKLNGGGHKTNAATQLSGYEKEEVKNKLLEILGGIKWK